MKIKALSILMGIWLLTGLFVPPSSARAWTIRPQKVTFANEQGITLTGWLFKPAGSGPFPAVVMMHGCAGVFSRSKPGAGITTLYREWGDRLVSAGFVALLVDSFTPRSAPQNQCNLSKAAVSEVKARPFDAFAGLEFLASKTFVSAERVGLLGWSQGGSSVMAAMDRTKSNRTFRFKAAAAFYPGCGLYNAFGGLRESTWKPYAPFVILLGSADQVVSRAICRARVTKAQALGAANTRLVLFKGAGHSFDLAVQVGGGFTQYDVDAKIAADAQMMKFFAARLR